MKRIREILIFALCLALAMAPAVEANSGPTRWEGFEGVGALAVDGDCPIVVEHESLTFDIPEFPDDYYSNEWELRDYAATVTAEYTFRNPTDADVTATLLFAYGLMPEYVNVYQYDYAPLMEDQAADCGVWVNGGAVDVTKRASLHDDGAAFAMEEDVSRLHGDFMEHAFYYPDMTVTRYLYTVTEVDFDTYAHPHAALELQNDPQVRKILGMGFDGGGVEGELVRLHGGLQDRGGLDHMVVYAIGEPFDAELRWKLCENGACETEIGGMVELEHTETLTLRDLAMEFWDEKYGISESDWYNAYIQKLDSREWAQGCFDSYVSGRMDLCTMRWFQYELTVPAGETVVNTVTAPIYPGIHLGYEPPIYDYTYLLSPAKGWADFGTLDIEIHTPFHLYESNLEGFGETEEGYALHLEGLPDKELTFTLSAARNPAKPGSRARTLGWLTAGAAVLVIGVLIRRRKRK